MKAGFSIHIIWIIAATVLLVAPVAHARRNSGDKPDMFVTCEISKPQLYERESALITVTLHSTTSDISSANAVSSPELKNGKFDYIVKTDTDRRGMRETIDGKTYYSFPLESYIVALHDKGDYEIKGGVYEVGVRRVVVYDDPFWGPTRGVRTEPVTVEMQPAKFKVKELPDVRSGENFTGTVGDFTVTTTIPPGRIYLNQTAVALVTVKGRGLLGKDVLPEYNSAFGNGVRLKAVSENRRSYFDGEDIVSELVLECEFIPTEKDAEIGNISFGYFNPATKRYEKAVSEPVAVKVESVSKQLETIDV